MKAIKVIAFALVFIYSAQMAATNLYLLNKTGDRLYYEYLYYSFFKVLGNAQVQEGWLDPNEGKILKSYRFAGIFLRPKRFLQDVNNVLPNSPKSVVSSFAGDPRILQLCQTGECHGTMLKSLKAHIGSQGILEGDQSIVHPRLAFPVVLVVTSDPVAKKAGQTKYIITELSSNKKGKTLFFNRLKAAKIPE